MANCNISLLPKYTSIAKMTRATRVTFGGAASTFLSISFLAVSLWKPVLVLILTLSGHPVGVAVGEFDERFVSKAKCNEFISGKKMGPMDAKASVDGQIAEITDHAFNCVPDTAGQDT